MQSPAPAVHTDDFRALLRRLDGDARSRHDAEYSRWLGDACWNRRDFDRVPDCIVHARSVDDVVRTVDFARSHRLSISVRASGHSYSGCFLRDDGVLLDVSALDAIDVDATARRATVQPGATSRRLNSALAPHGLAFPTGHGGNVGLSGFLLGGGLGVNFRAWGGMSVFNVDAVDLVDADGRRLHADATQNPELFWAARGGGPGLFFVVVKFHLNCRPLPACITSSAYSARFSRLAELLESIAQADPDPSLQVMVAIVPAESGAAEECGRQAVLSTYAFSDTPDHARALHRSLVARLPAGLVEPIAQDEASGMETIYSQSEAMMRCTRHRTDNILTDRPADAARILAAHLPSQPSPATMPLLIWRGEPPLPDAACSVRGLFFLSTYAQWNDAEDDERNRRWLAGLYDDLAEIASGCYVNEFDLEQRCAQAHRCFAAEHWRKLRQLRRRFDPNDVFHDVLTLRR